MAQDKVRAALRRYLPAGRGLSLTLALSGGADSMALLHMLRALEEECGYTLSAVHVNHGLRGEEACRDEDFVREICKEWGVRLQVCRAQVGAERLPGESLETAARRIRYALLEKAAADLAAGAGCGDYRIATAHTRSDQAETVLFRLIRGSGLKGAGGIPPVRERIVRPLLDVGREEVEAYCRENGIRYVTDSTNLSDDYARNRLRHGALPACRGVCPGAEQALARFAGLAREEDAFLDKLAAAELRRAAYIPTGWDAAAFFGLGQWKGDGLRALDPVLRRRALRLLCGRGGFTPESRQIEELEALLSEPSGRLELSGGWTAEYTGGRLRFLKMGKIPDYRLEVQPVSPLSPVEFPGGRLYLLPYAGGEIEEIRKIHNLLFKSLLDYDKIKGKIVLRARQASDRLAPAGRGLSKPLRRWYGEAAVPAALRSALPVLADGEGLIWVGGFGADRRAAADDATRRAVMAAWEPAAGPFGLPPENLRE